MTEITRLKCSENPWIVKPGETIEEQVEHITQEIAAIKVVQRRLETLLQELKDAALEM